MSNFTIKKEGHTSYTSVPDCFIEQYMPYAAGEFVKIYIYLLKCINENQSELSVSRIADAFNNTEKDVVRAFKYWQKKGLLKLTFDEDNALTSLSIVELSDAGHTLNVTDAPVPGQPGINTKHEKSAPKPSNQDAPAQSAAVLESVKTSHMAQVRVPEKKEYSKENLDAFAEQEEVKELLFIVHKYLGRPLSGQDTNTVLYLYDSLKFPADLIEYLFEYCVSNDHTNIRYIEKTALNWHSEGIRTVKAAKTLSGIYSQDCYRVMNAFGLGSRRPTRTESDYVSKWALSYGFDINIILKACERTMDQLHQPSFEYTDAILRHWRANAVTDLEDIKKLDEIFVQSAAKGRNTKKKDAASSGGKPVKFNNFKQRSYDFSVLEQQLFKKQ